MIKGRNDTPFKAFVQEMYMRHHDECKWYNIPCKYSGAGKYFKKNKWFLKRAFKESQRGNDVGC